MARDLPFFHVDAFTSQPFAGNPAGVVPEANGLTDAEMQLIARELRHSETAFVLPPQAGGSYRIRFFSPTAEVDLCGHATIATAWVLFKEGKAAATLRQETNVGILDLRIDRTTVWMAQAPPRVEPVDLPPGVIAEILGLEPVDIAVSIGPIQKAYTGNWHLIVPVWTREAIDLAEPDFAALAELNQRHGCVTTHLWTAKDLATRDSIYTRDFAPAVGVAEDPVTGSANGALGGYLALNGLLRKAEFGVEQGDAVGRPGRMTVRASRERVEIGGEAVIVGRGSLSL